jgi:hypothetical protein
MTRCLVAALACVLPAAAGAQSAAAVLAASDIWSEHLMQRPVELDGREWLALVTVDGRSSLQRVVPSWRGSVLFEDSVFALEVTPQLPPESLQLLVSGVPRIRPGPATTVVEYEASLWADERRLAITLGPAAYELTLDSTDPDFCDATITLSDGRASQTLYVPGGHPFDCDAPHFSVQWAGDLDGDRRLDLVTTFSPKYSWYPRQLFLSSAARPGELVGLVARTELAAA